MNKKMLIVISIIITILLIWLTIYSSKPDEYTYFEKETYEENKEELINQGGTFLKYGDNTIFIDEASNSIVKYSEKTNSANVIFNIKNYKLENHLHIVRNQLLYSYNGDTYCTDLNGESTKRFTNGELVYIDDDVYIYIVKEALLQYLYINSYDSELLIPTTEISFNLAKGYEINFLKKIDEILFFTSRNSDDSATLFSVDLKSQKTTVISRSVARENSDERYVYLDIIKLNNEYYYTSSQLDINTDFVTYSVLYVQEIDGKYAEFMENSVEPYLNIYKGEDEVLLFEKYDLKERKYKWYVYGNYEKKVLIQDLDVENIKKYFEKVDLDLLINGDKITSFTEKYANYKIKEVKHIKEHVYVLVGNDSGNYSWLLLNLKDTDDFVEMYEYVK